MNYGLMPNPQKELHLSFPIEKVRECILKIATQHTNDYKLERDDTVLNKIRITCRWGFTWHGFAEFSLFKIDETNTKVIIEAGDGKRGSINSNIEANNANNDIVTLQNYLSDYLSGNINEEGKPVSKKKVQGGCLLIFLAGIGISFIYFFV
jgi:hypothetical protein